MRAHTRVCGGRIALIAPPVERPADARHRVVEAERAMSREPLGRTNDGGFWPCSDNTSTSHDTAFGTTQARVDGTALCAWALGPS